LRELKAYLDRAAKGQGSTIFISGEAGIGKTRLVNELKEIAQSKAFQVLSGNCMFESLTPFMPIFEALKSGGLESLFTEAAPRVEAVYLMTHGGVLVKDVLRKETKLSPVLFTSMLKVVENFVNETLSILSEKEKENALNSIGSENFHILIESGKSSNLVVLLTGKENEFLIYDMKEIKLNIEKDYENVLKDWDGDEKSVKGIENIMNPLITSGKYDGINYGKDNPKIRRNLLFQNVSLGLTRYVKTAPTILCIEDLQWIDPSSLAMIHYFAKTTREYGLIIIGTYRPEDITAKDGKDHPLVGTMQMMNREDLLENMELTRLPEGNLDEFFEVMFRRNDFGDNFRKRIYKETEGNPLFVIQLIKYLTDEEIIINQEGKWTLTKDFEEIEIPSKVYNVIERRLNRLEKGDRIVLDYASVNGEMFYSSVLTTSLNMNRITLLEQLRGLEQNHRLIRSYNGKFKFDHAKIKKILYNQIPKELINEYHSIIGNSIEAMNKDNLDEVVGDLAFHYYQCRNKDKALRYLIKAAEKAKNEYSNEEAIRFFRQALEFEDDLKNRIEILEALGVLHRTIGDFDRSNEIYEKLLKLVKDNRKKARIKTIIGRLKFSSGKWDEILRVATEALELLNDDECKEKAYIFRLIGIVQISQGNLDLAFENHLKSLEIAQKFGDQLAIALSYEGLGHANWYKEEYNKSFEDHKKSLAARKKIGQEWEVMVALGNIGWAYIGMEDYDKALEHFEESLKMQQKMGELVGLGWTWWGYSEVYYGKGKLKEALKFINRAHDLSNEIGFKEVIAESKLMFGKIYREQKKWKDSIDNFEKSLIVFNENGMKLRSAESQFEYGLMWKAKGDVDKAKEHMNKALDMFNKLKIEKKIKNVRAVMESL
jgi:predicted ATPase